MNNSKTANKVLTIFLGIFIAFGAVLLIGTPTTYLKAVHLTKTGLLSDEVITEKHFVRRSGRNRIGTRGRSGTYHFTILFSTNQGEQVTFSPKWTTGRRAYEIGDKVTIIYDPANPHNATINLPYYIWGPSILLGAGGAIFVIFPTLILIALKKTHILILHGPFIRSHVLRTKLAYFNIDTFW